MMHLLSAARSGWQRFTFNRAQTIHEGLLLDVTETAQQAGFRWPVALTRSVWSNCVQWSPSDSKDQVTQDEAERLWDVLMLAANAARHAPQEARDILYRLYRVPRDGRITKPCLVRLHLRAHAGHAAEPVVTISLQSEAQPLTSV